MFFARLFAPLFVCLMVVMPLNASGEEVPMIPGFWDSQDRIIKPNVKNLQRLRFLTTTDFPPFSFIDKKKRLSGFHIDLARAICEELELLPVCQIQALPFAQLQSAVTGGVGEAVLGGIDCHCQKQAEPRLFKAIFSIARPFCW